MKTIQLSTVTNTRKNTSTVYYLTAITAKQKDELFEAKKNKTLEKLSIIWDIDCVNVLKVGVTSEVSTPALSDYVGFFKGYDLGEGRKLHYRDYNFTEEQQEESAWLINFCEDTASSVRSALRQMNEEWCILWETDINSDFNKLDDGRT